MAFEKLFRLIRFFETLKAGELAILAIQNNQEIQTEILNLNRLDQLFTKHIDSEGAALFSVRHQSGVYSITTQIISKGRKVAGQPYTLFDKGDFFSSFQITFEKDAFIIGANPIKEGNPFGGTNLFEEYGKQILGLTEENKKLLGDKVVPLIQDHIRNKLRTL